MKKIIFASSIVKLADAVANCNNICTSDSDTAIPGSKNCKHYCKCTEKGHGTRTPAGDGSIFSSSQAKIVAAPGGDTDCPGRPKVESTNIQKLERVEKIAEDEIISEIGDQEGVDDNMLDLEKTIGKDVVKNLIEFGTKEEDDENDTEEETVEALVTKLTDGIIKDAREKQQPNAYSIVKKDVKVKVDDDADSEESKFKLPEDIKVQKIILHFKETSGSIYTTCPERDTCTYGLWGIATPQPKPLVVLKKIGQDGEEDKEITAVELSDVNQDNLEFVGNFTAGQYEVSIDNDGEQQDPTSYLRVSVRVPQIPDDVEVDEVKKKALRMVVQAEVSNAVKKAKVKGQRRRALIHKGRKLTLGKRYRRNLQGIGGIVSSVLPVVSSIAEVAGPLVSSLIPSAAPIVDAATGILGTLSGIDWGSIFR